MRAVALNDVDESHSFLTIQTEVGRLRGTWRGAGTVAAGDQVDVELELPRPRRWEELTITTTLKAELQADDALQGLLATVFDDGVVVIQIGGAAVQVEMLDPVPAGEIVGKEVVLIGDDLEFYPTGV